MQAPFCSALVLTVLAWTGVAHAAVCSWQSAVSSTWTTAANWSCGHSPSSGDDVVLPASGGLQTTVTNDNTFTIVNSITVSGNGYNLGGNLLIITATGINSTAAVGPTIAAPISIGVIDQSITNNGTGTLDFVTGGIAGNTYNVTFTGSGPVAVNAPFSGSGTVVKSGTGVLTFAAANTYTGSTSLQAGTLRLAHAQALGDASVGTTLLGSGKLEVTAGAIIPEPISVVSSGSPVITVITGLNQLNGAMTFLQDATITNNSGGHFKMNGAISGSIKLTLVGYPIELNNDNNTYSGGLVVQTLGGASHASGLKPFGTGTVTVVEDSALVVGSTGPFSNPFLLNGPGTASQATLIVGSSGTILSGPITLAKSPIIDVTAGGSLTFSGVVGGSGAEAKLTKRGLGALKISTPAVYQGATQILVGTLVLGASEVIPDTTTVQLGAMTGFDLFGHSETIGALTGSGDVYLAGASTFTFGDASDATYSGAFVGNADAVIVQGTGTKTWAHSTDACDYVGPVQVNAGTLVLSGAVLPSATMTVNPAGRLGLSGATVGGAVNVAGGVLAPGAAVPRTGTSGNLSLDAASKLEVRLDGAASGEHTQHSVLGTVALGDATLDSAFGFTPAVGDSFTIIDNDDVDAVVGTFAGLAEGADLVVGAVTVSVHYAGGTGNDVVISVSAVAVDTDGGANGDGGVIEDASTGDDAAIAGLGDGNDGGCSVAGRRGGMPIGVVFLWMLGLWCARRLMRSCGSRHGCFCGKPSVMS